MPPLPESAPSAPAANPTICPGCSEPQAPGDRFCGRCGLDLAAPPPGHAAAADAAATTTAAAAATATATATTDADADAASEPEPGAAAPGAAAGPAAAQEASPAPSAPSAPPASSARPDAPRAAGPAGPAAGAATAPGRAEPPAADSAAGPASGSAGAPEPGPNTRVTARRVRRPDPREAEFEPDSGSTPHITDAFLLAPPLPGSDDTLPLGVPVRLADPDEEEPEPETEPTEPAPAAEEGPVCVACGLGGVDDDGYCEHCGHAQPRQRDHQEKELEGVAAVSDRGLRHHRNEDAFTLGTAALPDGGGAVAAVVCDGVSTAYRPDDASAAASSVGRQSLLTALESGTAPEDAMRDALVAAFDAVTALDAEEPEPDQPRPPHHNAPACTIVSAVITGPVFTVGWVGDSRAYWIPDDRDTPSARLTEDDSWAERMVSAGLMTQAEAFADSRAHAITGWLGADAIEVDPHVSAFQPEGPGVIVVCTDGLWNYAESADEMAAAVPADARARPLAGARTLLGVALDGGGHDNVTVAVLPFPAGVARAESPPA